MPALRQESYLSFVYSSLVISGLLVSLFEIMNTFNQTITGPVSNRTVNLILG